MTKEITDVPKVKGITLILKKKLMWEKGKDGKLKIVKTKKVDGTMESRYMRHDLSALVEMMNSFNSKVHQIRDFQSWTGITQKIRKLQLEQEEDEKDMEINLSIDEAHFLKGYIKDYNDKDGKEAPPLSGASIQAIPDFLEQLSS